MASNLYPTLDDAFMKGVIDRSRPSQALIGTTILPLDDIYSETAEWDVKYGGPRRASFVAKDAPAHVLKARQVKKMFAKLAFSKEKQPIDESTLALLRPIGVGVNSPENVNKIAAAKKKIADVTMELTMSEDMLIEWAIFQCLQGTLQFAANGVVVDVDYGLADDHFYTPDNLWSVLASADILGDLKTLKQRAIADGAPVPTKMILSTYAYDLITENEAIRDLLAYKTGDQLVSGSSLPGNVLQDIELIKYDVTYEDYDGVTQRILPQNKVLLMADRGPAGELIGSTIQGPSKAGNFEPGRWARTWDDVNTQQTWIEVGHYFLPVLKYPDWDFVLTVTA